MAASVLQPRRLGEQLPVGCAQLVLERHSGGVAYQEMVAKMTKQSMWVVVKMKRSQGAAWRWSCFLLSRKLESN